MFTNNIPSGIHFYMVFYHKQHYLVLVISIVEKHK